MLISSYISSGSPCLIVQLYSYSCVRCHSRWIHFWTILTRILKNRLLRYTFQLHACYIPATPSIILWFLPVLEACFLMPTMYLLPFQLSLFGEMLYEMLQYQMGCRVLEFLQVGFDAVPQVVYYLNSF